MALKLLFAIILLTLLTACHFVLVTDHQLVKKAIALQVSLSQEQVSKQFFSVDALPNFAINQIDIREVQSLNIQHLPSFRVLGTYDLTIQFGTQPKIKQHNLFEVYLQQQEGKTWRLLRPQRRADGSIDWGSYLLQ